MSIDTSTVECFICKKLYGQLTGQHLKTHGYTTKQYKDEFNLPTISEDALYKIRTTSGNAKASAAYVQKCKTIVDKYNITPNKCKQCNGNLVFLNRHYKFCSSSCSATYNNIHRSPIEPKFHKIHCSICKDIILCNNRVYNKRCNECKSPTLPATRIKYTNCFVCSKLICGKGVMKYCREHTLDRLRKRDAYRFKFNVYKYPDLFDLAELSLKGWYSPGGKSGKWNIEGLSRDHKVSTNSAIDNLYDPYYISHPINCQLITQSENSKKNASSSLSYTELVLLVDAYDVRSSN